MITLKPIRRILKLWRNTGMNKGSVRHTLLICLALMTLPVLLCLFFYISYSSHTMQQEIYRNMQMSVEQAKNNMDNRMAQLEKISSSILSTVYPSLNSTVDIDRQLDEYNEISRLLTQYQSQNMIAKLRLYVPDEKMYSHQRDMFYPLSDLEGEDDGAIRLGVHWQEVHEVEVQFGYPQISAISCVSTITSATRYGHVIGGLCMDVDISEFVKMLSAGIDEEAALSITDGAGKAIIHQNPDLIGQNLFSAEKPVDLSAASAQIGAVEVNGETHLMVARRLSEVDWYLVMTVPRHKVYSYGVFSLDIMRLILLVLIVTSLLIAIVVTYNGVVFNALRRMNHAIDRAIDNINRGGLETIEQENCPPQEGPSLSTLEQKTNLMVATVDHLLESRYQEQLAIRDYQMKALQAQINPHFLYNTLDIIKWMIADGRNEESVWMINSLSRYFQLSLSSGRDIVHIEEEIHLTRTYIGIMQKRFQDVFTSQFDVEPGAERLLIPKLSLQPIIENALLHGILYAEKNEKRVWVRVAREDGRLVIDVEDNGNGMDDRTIEAIRGTDGESESLSGHYGLSNVVRRLRLFGAREDGFEIHSRPGIGTCVTLRLPIKEDTEGAL